VAMVEKEKNEITKPNVRKYKRWWVCLLDLTITIMIFNPYFLHLCLLRNWHIVVGKSRNFVLL
jgi:hypothetical protein